MGPAAPKPQGPAPHFPARTPCGDDLMLTARMDVTGMLIFSERHSRSVLADSERLDAQVKVDVRVLAPTTRSDFRLTQQPGLVGGEYAPVRLLQVSPGFYAQLADAELPRPLIDGQCVGRAAASVERQHQLGPEAFPFRVLPAQFLKVGYDVGRSGRGELEICVDPCFLRGQPQSPAGTARTRP